MDVKTFVTLINLFIVSSVGQECSRGLSYTDPDLGTVNLEPEIYCDPRNLRIPGSPICCLPWPPSGIFPVFTLFPAQKPYSYTIDWRRELPQSIATQIANTNVYYVVQGYGEPGMYTGNQWQIPAAKSLNSSGNSVIIVDWQVGADTQYGQALANLRTVGKTIAFSLFKWKVYKRAKLVGHSLGAQAIHEASKFAKKLKNFKPKYCLGLDPAGPGFEGTKGNNIHLNRNSCELVNVIHTSSSIYPSNLNTIIQESGIYYKSGHCDWWINCGRIQRKCIDYTENQILNAIGFPSQPNGDFVAPQNNLLFCSHHVSMGTWITSMRRCRFIGHPCFDCGKNDKFKTCNFDVHQNVPFLQCNSNQNVNYYVKTTPFPFC